MHQGSHSCSHLRGMLLLLLLLLFVTLPLFCSLLFSSCGGTCGGSWRPWRPLPGHGLPHAAPLPARLHCMQQLHRISCCRSAPPPPPGPYPLPPPKHLLQRARRRHPTRTDASRSLPLSGPDSMYRAVWRPRPTVAGTRNKAGHILCGPRFHVPCPLQYAGGTPPDDDIYFHFISRCAWPLMVRHSKPLDSVVFTPPARGPGRHSCLSDTQSCSSCPGPGGQ